jgi:hypothetical protein
MGMDFSPSKGRGLGSEYQQDSQQESLSACSSSRNGSCPHFLWITLWMKKTALDYLREKRWGFAFGAKPSQSINSIKTISYKYSSGTVAKQTWRFHA